MAKIDGAAKAAKTKVKGVIGDSVPLLAIALLLLAGAPAMAHAQVGFGIKGGLSYGTASNQGLDPGATDRSGFALGVGAVTGSMLGLGIEGLYAQRGFESTTTGSSRRLDYIDVPIYVRLALPAPAFSPFAYAGPQASYELQCGAGGGDCPDSGRPDVTYAAVIGAGLQFGMLGGLTAEARYVYGLTDLNLRTVTSSESYRTRSLLVLLGFGF